MRRSAGWWLVAVLAGTGCDKSEDTADAPKPTAQEEREAEVEPEPEAKAEVEAEAEAEPPPEGLVTLATGVNLYATADGDDAVHVLAPEGGTPVPFEVMGALEGRVKLRSLDAQTIEEECVEGADTLLPFQLTVWVDRDDVEALGGDAESRCAEAEKKQPEIEPPPPAETSRFSLASRSTVYWPGGETAGTVLSEFPLAEEPNMDEKRPCFTHGRLRLCMDASKVFELARTAEERPTITVGENGPHVGILGTIVGKPESGSDTGLEPGESDDEDAGKMKVLGSLDRDIIKRVIRSHLSEIKYCYERELRKDPKLRGSVDVRFTIGPTGSVSASMTPRNTTGSEALESCLAKAVKRWKFPKPTGGGIVVVTYPFVFKPA